MKSVTSNQIEALEWIQHLSGFPLLLLNIIFPSPLNCDVPKMNLHYISLRKKDSVEKDCPPKNPDVSLKKNLKRSSNAILHDLALEHASAYFKKPWDHYLKDASPEPSSSRSMSCLGSESQCDTPQEEERSLNSCVVYQKHVEDDYESSKGAEEPVNFPLQLKGKKFVRNVLVKCASVENWKELRREPRYDYTALADESYLQERLEMDRKLFRDSDRNMAMICCQYYLRGSNRYVFLQHLPDMGSRVGKSWYLVRDGTTKTERLLTMTPVAEACPIKYNSQTRQVLLELFLAIQHPYIYPVLDIDRKIIMEQEYVIAVIPFNEEGTLKDIIYQSHCRDDWKDKYHYHGYGLCAAQIQRLGCQILEALLFLKDQKFPPFLHLHSGNVIVQNGVARVAGLENTLFGYSSRFLGLVLKKLQDYKECVEVMSFGHLIFEMAAGYELTSCQPSEKNYKDIEHLPAVIDVLKFIFDQVRHRHPSLRQIASLEFFRHIDLRELRSLMPVPSIKTKLSSAALALLKDVKRSQRSKRRNHSAQSVPSIETESVSSKEGSSKRSSKRKKKSQPESSELHKETSDPGTLLKTLPLSEVETSDPVAGESSEQTKHISENPSKDWSLLLLDIQKGVRLKSTPRQDPMA